MGRRADVNVEAEIAKRGSDHLLATVVTILAKLRDQDARPTPFARQELLDLLLNLCDRPGAIPETAGIN
jgi:hypothetical protein